MQTPATAPLPQHGARSTPSFPVEVLTTIIKPNLPPPSFKTHRERYKTLLPLALVNKQFAAIAQRLLFGDVKIRGGRVGAFGTARALALKSQEPAIITESLWVEMMS